MDIIYNWFQQLNEVTGINLPVFYNSFDRERFFSGLLVTIELSVVSLIASVVIGVVGAWLQGSKLVWTRRVVQTYIQFFRNTPPLVQMYFFFFGLSALLPTVENEYGFQEPILGAFAWACISLSFFAGAFNVEIFRSGIEAVPETTREAAESLGYSRLGAYIHVILPLAFRVCLPALNNNLVNLVKTTTLAYAIAVPELLYASSQIWADYANVPEMMTLLLFIYVGLVGIVVMGMNRWERAMRLPGYGT